MDQLDAFDDHPSLAASLEDFEHNDRSPTFGLPSQHSGFKSDESEPEGDSTSEGPWSPPAWRRQTAEAAWYRHQPYAQDHRLLRHSPSPSRSRTTSPRYQSAKEAEEGDTIQAANIPLPRGSMSPIKEQSPSPEATPHSQDAHFENRARALPDQLDATATTPDNNCMLPKSRVNGIHTDRKPRLPLRCKS